MCGIAGLYDFTDKHIDKSEIVSMTETLSHRGPNGQGFFLDGTIGLGHRRLSIFDLSDAGSQPMVSLDGNHVIIFNGEIYNWPEIRKNLGNIEWRSKTDTETILNAYIKHGPNCLKLFNGMFSIVIWNKKDRSLFIARDRVGIKPLYYGVHSNRLFFASEMKAFFRVGFPKEPNFDVINDFLQWGLIDHSEKTFFTGISSLSPGCYMMVDPKGNKKIKRYWDLVEVTRNSRKYGPQEAVEEYKALLKDSIALRVRSDVPVGVFLSGGVDSSIIAAQLAESSSLGGIEAYTYDFQTGGAGESEYAAEVAKFLNLNHKICKLSYTEVPELFSEVLFYEEMPVTSLRVLAAHKLYKEYKADGATVILEGHGGDHLGAGFEYYFMAHLIDLIMREGSSYAFEEMINYMKVYKIPKKNWLKKLFNVIGAINRVGSSTQDGINFVKNNCLNKDFISQKYSSRDMFPRPFDTHLLNAQYIDLFFHNMPRVLRYADRGSMASGREARVPILDHRLVEFSFSTLEEARIANNQQRYFMRKANQELLPEKVLSRPKRSIVDPQRSWLQNELRPWALDLFSSNSFGSRGIFDQSEVLNEYNNFCNQSDPETGFHIYQYLNVELWFREMFG